MSLSKDQKLLPPFSGQPELDLDVLSRLPDIDLSRVCRSNEYLNGLCQDKKFWRKRFYGKYETYVDDFLWPGDDYQDAYRNMAKPVDISTKGYRKEDRVRITNNLDTLRLMINAADSGYIPLLKKYYDSLAGLKPFHKIILLSHVSLDAPMAIFIWLASLPYKQLTSDLTELAARLLHHNRIDAVTPLWPKINKVSYGGILFEYVWLGNTNPNYIEWCILQGISLVERDPDIGASSGAAAIDAAARSSQLDIIKYFVRKGVNPAGDDQDAIYEALANGSLPIIRYLLKKGANPSRAFFQYPDHAGHPIDPDLIRFIIEKGGKVDYNTLEGAIDHKDYMALDAYLSDESISAQQKGSLLGYADDKGDNEAIRVIEDHLQFSH